MPKILSPDYPVLVEVYQEKNHRCLIDQVMINLQDWQLFYEAAKGLYLRNPNGFYGETLSLHYILIREDKNGQIINFHKEDKNGQLNKFATLLVYQLKSKHFKYHNRNYRSFHDQILHQKLMIGKDADNKCNKNIIGPIENYARHMRAQLNYEHEIKSRREYETNIDKYHNLAILQPDLINIVRQWMKSNDLSC